MPQKDRKILERIVTHEMKGSVADKKFKQLEIEYGKKLNELYERREEKRRSAEDNLKDFMITF